MQIQLRNHVDKIRCLDLCAAIKAIVKLAPDLTTSITPTGTPLVEHPGFEGSVELNDMATLYMECAARCMTEHASFEVRLLHVSMEQTFTNLYRKANAKFRAGFKDGSIVPEEKYEVFGCYSGRTGTVFANGLHEGNALYFHEEEYHQFWGLQECQSSMFLWHSDTGETFFALRASTDQVEEAMAQMPLEESEDRSG